jgi:4-carboxymuconolactone decarboxylase
MLGESLQALIHAATLAVRPTLRAELLEFLHNLKEKNIVAPEELYEVFLQTYLFAGFPAALESVRLLEKVFGSVHSNSIPIEEDIAAEYLQFIQRGSDLYKQIYATNATRVRDELLRLSPELATWALVEGYGKTLSRPGLESKSRELCIVAQLTQLGWERQLYSHLLGAKNTGASIAEITEAVSIGARGDSKVLSHAEQLVKKLV